MTLDIDISIPISLTKYSYVSLGFYHFFIQKCIYSTGEFAKNCCFFGRRELECVYIEDIFLIKTWKNRSGIIGYYLMLLLFFILLRFIRFDFSIC